MDVFLLIITIMIGFLLIYSSLYLFAIYSHPEDKGFSGSYVCMVTAVLVNNLN
jgi:hypothetical protein